jgi:hypothetical protein
MSCGAVVITTDAPPMNEFIQDPRFLVPYTLTIEQYLGIRYKINKKALAAKVCEILTLSPEELRAAGEQNRAAYLERDRLFHEKLRALIEEAKQNCNISNCGFFTTLSH